MPFHTVNSHLEVMERLSDSALAYKCTNADLGGRYTIEKQIISNPESACLLQHTRVTAGSGRSLEGLKLYALCAAHLEVGGGGNNGYLVRLMDKRS